MIQATNLIKQFKGIMAVNDVSLHIDKGTIFGLLGPNAAGKTTVIRMLCGIIKSDGGEVTLNGMNINMAKPDFGYVAQHFGQYEELTVWENLKFYASMYGVTDDNRLSYLLDRYHLANFKHTMAGELSGGYQRRLSLVCALAHNPKVLFLDEPTAGIDPVTRKLLWDDFYQLSTEGKTLFVTTHYMEEAQRCHQLAFISSGKIVAEGSPDTIMQALGKAKAFTSKITYLPKIHQALYDLKGMILVNQFGNELRIVVSPDLKQEELQATISSVTGESCTVNQTEPNIEDVFIVLTQDKAEKK
ncbi:MAG: multidrug ABC transporter ATP-binding protein [Gammaproteobacteria bacterium]|nr:MAG: multidrug ABC transporter ATP-binding protein [Gammaproteobacteria bacterium]